MALARTATPSPRVEALMCVIRLGPEGTSLQQAGERAAPVVRPDAEVYSPPSLRGLQVPKLGIFLVVVLLFFGFLVGHDDESDLLQSDNRGARNCLLIEVSAWIARKLCFLRGEREKCERRTEGMHQVSCYS